MSRLKYNASDIKDIIQPMMPSNTTKAQRERIYVTVCFTPLSSPQRGEGTTGSNAEKVPYILCETELPTYTLSAAKRLLPKENEEAEEKKKLQLDIDLTTVNSCKVLTCELLDALKVFGTNLIDIELLKSGDIELRADGGLEQGGSTIRISGTTAVQPEMPKVLTDGCSAESAGCSSAESARCSSAESVECSSAELAECIVLQSQKELLRGLNVSVSTANTEGNENTQRCIHLHLHRDALIVESAYNEDPCCYETDEKVYAVAPSEDINAVLSIDTARTLMQMLPKLEDVQVRIAKNADTLVIQSGNFTMEADVQSVVCRDYCKLRDYTYEQTWPFERRTLLQALQAMRTMGKKEVAIQLECDDVLLSDQSLQKGECTLRVPVSLNPNLSPKREGSGLKVNAGKFSVSRMIKALATCFEETEATISRDQDSTSLCIDCGKLRMIVRQA